jgi:hypothetical protein
VRATRRVASRQWTTSCACHSVDTGASPTSREWRRCATLCCASLRQLGELGFDEAALGVDTQNPSGAFKLYESLGYRVVATEVQYQREIVA